MIEFGGISTTRDARARWEDERHAAFLAALVVGALALLGLVLASVLWGLSPVSAVLSIVAGSIVWHLFLQGTVAVRDRLAIADPFPVLQQLGHLGITVAALLIFILGLSGALGMPGVGPVLVLGGFAYAGFTYGGRAREIGVLRNFIRVEDDGRVVGAPRGTPILTALEGAGYRIMTQCGREGKCSTCRVRVREGREQWSERHYGRILTPKQRSEGWVLACQAPLEDDLTVELDKPLVLRWPQTEARPSRATRAIRRALPGFDCEACGYNTCLEYAQAIAKGDAPISRCHPGGRAVKNRLQEIAEELRLSTGE